MTKKFTARENQVGKLLAKGFSRKMIADKLSMSIHTLDIHLKNIRAKLGVFSSLEAAVFLSKNS